ncbi:MAG: hypothetical protein OEW83_16705, partial [Acidimicrobiia bacterium]|nr:hypothetical protein [Acidimicrobiia bacterium]
MTGDDSNAESESEIAPETVPDGGVQAVDELPADLQPDLVDHDEYIFPNNNRRRIPGYLYLGIAAVLVVVYLLRGDGVFVNAGYL